MSLTELRPAGRALPRREKFLLAVCAVVTWAQPVRAQALAQFDGDTLLLRTFTIPSVSANPFAPRQEPSEHQLRFRAEDVRVFRVDGTLVKQADWQKMLKMETAVRFSGYAIIPADKPAAPTPKFSLLAQEQELYRADALIVQGVRSPIAQKPLPLPKDFPKGGGWRLAVASVAGSRLTVVETSESHSHYPPRLDGSEGNVEKHIFRTTKTVVTTELRLSDAAFRHADGTQFAPGAAAAVLRDKTPVLLADDASGVHPYFLRLIRPRAVVVFIPPPPGFGPGPGVVAPKKKA